MAGPAALDLSALRAALDDERSTWTMAATSMTALTEEQRQYRLGVPPTPGLSTSRLEDSKDDLAAAALAATQAVGAPAAFDLRDINGVDYSTGVHDQGACGSCVAFGTAGALEGVARYTRGLPALAVDFSEAHLFYVYGRAAGALCSTGWWPDQAYNAVRDKGVTFENYYPYRAGDQDGNTLINADWPNRLAKAVGVTVMTGNAGTMKQYISTYGSISACLDVYQDFYSYGSGVYKHVTGNYAGGHCITLIGYSDAEQCWIGKNSWGTNWGTGGFLKIGYGECRIESYQTVGAQGVNLRWWNPDQLVSGLWSNDVDGNAWVYGAERGWLKLDGGVVATNAAMLAELAASKAGNKKVGLFEDANSVQQMYAW
jgi:C1A family cysteine protease